MREQVQEPSSNQIQPEYSWDLHTVIILLIVLLVKRFRAFSHLSFMLILWKQNRHCYPILQMRRSGKLRPDKVI